MKKLKGTSKSSLILNADEKVRSAKILAESNQFDDAIYMCGYAIEFLLKAIVCDKQNISIYPDDKKGHRIHNIEGLIDLAGIRQLLTTQFSNDINFQINWSLATRWSPEMRYETPNSNTKENCEEFLDALTNSEGGVLTWLKSLL